VTPVSLNERLALSANDEVSADAVLQGIEGKPFIFQASDFQNASSKSENKSSKIVSVLGRGERSLSHE
jgi:hypothetical protein